MFSRLHIRWMAGAVLMLGLFANILGAGTASAQTMTATSTPQLIIEGGASATAGAVLTVQGTGFAAGEPVSLWINVPDGTTIAQDSLGQTNTAIEGTVIPLHTPASADAYGAFTYSLDTSGLPSGNYSLVADGQTSGVTEVSALTITGPAVSPAPPTVAGESTLAAGTMFNVQGAGYTADEPVSLWVNIPNGTTISSNSLGQTDTTIDGSVIPVDAMATADAYGAFTYSLNTAGLPSGDYSLVAHGLTSGVEMVFKFTVNGAVSATHLAASGNTTVAAGTTLTFQGTAYQADEPVGLWINIPNGTTISNNSLGQTDTTIDGSVIPVDAMATADDNGAFTYTLNTAGLPSGTYSLVAQGLNSTIDGVVTFTIQ